MTEETRNNGGLPKGKKREPHGGMNDSWMLDIVDDPETDRMLSELMVEEEVGELGMAREAAEAAFLPLSPESGDRQSRPHPSHASPRFPEPEIEVEDLYRMMSDIMTGKTKPHIDTKAGWEAWRTLEREIADIKAQGGVVDFPAI